MRLGWWIKELLSEKYIIFNKYPNKALPLTDFLFSMSLPMISTSSASKRDCLLHHSGSSENTRNLMLLCLLRKCSIASWRVFTCQVSMVLNHHRISVYANTAQSQLLHKNKRIEYVGWLQWTKWVGGDGKNQLFVVSVSRRLLFRITLHRAKEQRSAVWPAAWSFYYLY